MEIFMRSIYFSWKDFYFIALAWHFDVFVFEYFSLLRFLFFLLPLALVEKPERIFLVRANKKARRIFCFAKFSVQIASNTIFETEWIASCSCVTTSNYQHNNFFQLFEKLPQNAVDRWMQTNFCFHFIFSPRYPRIELSLFFRYINEEFWNKHWNPRHSLAINHFPLVKLFSWIASLIKTPAWPFKTLLSEEVWCFSSKDVEILCRVASRATSHKWESNYLIFSTQICRIQSPARFKKTNK